MRGSVAGPVLGALAAAALAAAPEPARTEPAPEDAYPGAGAAYLVALDGRVLWARAADVPRPPASLTKIMTALVALESGAAEEGWVLVSARAARETGSKLGLRAGEVIRVGDALRATLVASANDACLALAEHVGGSAPAFVERMNRRAAALGLAGTRFANPCGHDAPGHTSTARDLHRLAAAALALPAFREIVALPEGRLVTRGGRTVAFKTGNALLGRVPGAAGVKTGFTNGAGRCLVALARRGESEVVVVLLDAADRWWAAAALLEAAFREARPGG